MLCSDMSDILFLYLYQSKKKEKESLFRQPLVLVKDGPLFLALVEILPDRKKNYRKNYIYPLRGLS